MLSLIVNLEITIREKILNTVEYSLIIIQLAINTIN